jgi:hypothetical protein
LAWWRKIRDICNPIKLERTEPIKLETKKRATFLIRVICNPIKLERTEPIKLERKKELLIKPSLLG